MGVSKTQLTDEQNNFLIECVKTIENDNSMTINGNLINLFESKYPDLKLSCKVLMTKYQNISKKYSSGYHVWTDDENNELIKCYNNGFTGGVVDYGIVERLFKQKYSNDSVTLNMIRNHIRDLHSNTKYTSQFQNQQHLSNKRLLSVDDIKKLSKKPAVRNTVDGVIEIASWSDVHDAFIKERYVLIVGKKNKYCDLVKAFNQFFTLNVTEDQMRWHINKRKLIPLECDINNNDDQLSDTSRIFDQRIWIPQQLSALNYARFDFENLFVLRDKINLNMTWQTFLLTYQLKTINIPKNGLCFINSILLFLAEAFDICPEYEFVSKRILDEIFCDWEETEQFICDNDQIPDKQMLARRMHDQYFNQRIYDTQMIDIIVCRSCKWFGLTVLIVDDRNPKETEIFKLVFTATNGPSLYPTYDKMIVLMRSGEVDKNVTSAHYDLIVPKNYQPKYLFQDGILRRVMLNSCIGINLQMVSSTPKQFPLQQSIESSQCTNIISGLFDTSTNMNSIIPTQISQQQNKKDSQSIFTIDGTKDINRTTETSSQIHSKKTINSKTIAVTVIVDDSDKDMSSGDEDVQVEEIKEKLFNAVCYNCGMLLKGTANHTHKYKAPFIFTKELYQKDPLKVPIFKKFGSYNMPPEQLLFSKSHGHMYSCKCCRNGVVSLFDIGHPVTGSYELPKELKGIVTESDKKFIGLAQLDCCFIRPKNTHQVNHAQGISDVNSKSFAQLSGMLGIFVKNIKNSSIVNAIGECIGENIRNALNWLFQNNIIYSKLYMTSDASELDDRTVAQSDLNDSLEANLGKEKSGLLTLADIDCLNLPYVNAQEHILGLIENRIEIMRTAAVKNYDDDVEAKLWPLLFPYGSGSFKKNQGVTQHFYLKQRILNWHPDFRRNDEYAFFFYDQKVRSKCMYNAKQVKVPLLDGLTAEDAIEITTDRYTNNSKYKFFGSTIPRTLNGSKSYWYSKYLDLLAMTHKFGTPDFFITFTQNDSWVELKDCMINGFCGERIYDQLDYSIKDFALEAALCFNRRFLMTKGEILSDTKRPLGKVKEYWWRREYQKRGSVHIHMVVWISDKSTIPVDAVVAEIPRQENYPSVSSDEIDRFRKAVQRVMEHTCSKERCITNTGKCKYGYPFEINDSGNSGRYGQYKRTHAEDSRVVPYNLQLLLLWEGHLNVLKIDENYWSAYISKYVSKPEPTDKTKLFDRELMVERYFSTRIVSAMEAHDHHMQHMLSQGSRQVIYLPSDLTCSDKILLDMRQLKKKHTDSEDIYCMSKIEKYVNRAEELRNVNYSHYFEQYEEIKQSQAKNKIVYKDKKNRLYIRRNKECLIRYAKYLKTDLKEKEKYYSQLLIATGFLMINEFDVCNMNFNFSNQNQSSTFEEECSIRKLNETECPSYQYSIDVSNKSSVTDDRINVVCVGETSDILNNTLLPTFQEKQMQDEESTMIEELIRWEKEQERNKKIDSLSNLLVQFSDDQRAAFRAVTTILENTSFVQCIIGGAAGCGKSYLLDGLEAHFLKQDLRYAKLAPTGVAASLINGFTLHFFFKISTKDNKVSLNIQKDSEEWKHIQKTDVFVIDEFSMVEMEIFALIDNLLKNIHNTSHFFGKKSLILMGDPGQLPAIECNIYDYKPFKTLPVMLLENNMRQVNDQEFQNVLLNIRKCKIDTNEIKFLESKKLKDGFDVNKCPLYKTSIIVSKKEEKDQYNKLFLHRLSSSTVSYYAIDLDAQGNHTNKIRDHIYPKVLDLKIGAKVMLLRNISIKNGWVNGAMCKVIDLDENSVKICQINRNKQIKIFRHKSTQNNMFTNIKSFRTQIPLELGWAMTVHKSQGLTLELVFIDLTKSFFEMGQAYVALSRVSSSSGLHLINFDIEALNKSNERLLQIIEDLEKRDILHDRII